MHIKISVNVIILKFSILDKQPLPHIDSTSFAHWVLVQDSKVVCCFSGYCWKDCITSCHNNSEDKVCYHSPWCWSWSNIFQPQTLGAHSRCCRVWVSTVSIRLNSNIEYILVCAYLCCSSRAIEEFLRRNPQHVNLRRPVDGHVALHIAAVHNRFDVVSFLAQMVCYNSTPVE